MSPLERIVEACGGDLLDGGRRALIPGPGHSPRDRSVSLLEGDDGHILIYCFSPKDDWRDVRRALEERGLLIAGDKAPEAPWTGATASPPPRGERVLRAKRFWDEALAVRSTIAERYLKHRAVQVLADLPALRFHPAMTSLEDRLRRPALLSAIVGDDGDLQGVEITLLSPDGSAKASLNTPRRIVGRMMGGAVRLGEPDDRLIVGEGVMSVASASCALRLPAWALLGAHNLALFTPPSRVKRIVIATDHDAAGSAAYRHLKRRLAPSSAVDCAPPPRDYSDWNDWARLKAQGV